MENKTLFASGDNSRQKGVDFFSFQTTVANTEKPTMNTWETESHELKMESSKAV